MRRGSQARRCTCGRATGPPGCRARRSSLCGRESRNKLLVSAKGSAHNDEGRTEEIRTLVDGKVAAVAEDDGVAVLAVGVVADGAGLLLARHLASRVRDPLRQLPPLLLNPVEGDRKELVGEDVRHWIIWALAVRRVDGLDPGVVLRVHVVLDLVHQIRLDRVDRAHQVDRLDKQRRPAIGARGVVAVRLGNR
jgi:hypothetical protein